MIEVIAILAALAIGIILVLLAPEIALLLALIFNPRDRFPEFCRWLCRLRIFLGWLLGLLTGLFLCLCWLYLRVLLGWDPVCLTALFLALLLALFAALWYVMKLLQCAFQNPKSYGGFGGWMGRLRLGLLLLALLILIGILYFARFPLRDLFFNTICGWLALAMIIVMLLFLVLYAWEIWFCDGGVAEKDCDGVLQRRYLLVLFFLLIALWQLWACREDLADYDAGLGMVGIHWQGKYPGEEGAHLRWSFEPALGFPDGGFDLYRRETGSFGWTKLNADRIHPARAWTGPVPAGAIDEWEPLGETRVPTVIHSRFTGANTENFEFLLDMIARDPMQPLFYVAGIDTPFADAVSAQAQADALAAADPDGAVPLQWETEPISLLMTMALHPEIARLLGLYWIDQSGDPGVEYEYRVIGQWGNVLRTWRVEELSGPNTLPLDQPVLQSVASVPAPARPLPNGAYWPTEAYVTLAWEPPTATPEFDLTKADGIKPVFHRVERQDLGPVDGTPLAAPEDFAAIEVPADAEIGPGDPVEFVAADPVLVLPEEVEGQPDQWPDVFAYDGYVDYRTYNYRVLGIDIFGRESPASASMEVDVRDEVAPPGPVSVESQIWQVQDSAIGLLLPADRDALFPTDPAVNNGNPVNEMALRVSWLWPHAYRDRVQDLKAFEIRWRPDPGNANTNWEGVLATVADGSTLPLPARHAGTEADYFEISIVDLPQGFLDAFAAGDADPVLYGQITVIAVDHDNFNNESNRVPHAVVFARDLIPPDPPAAPMVTQLPGTADRNGNANVGLAVGGTDPLHSYRLYRVAEPRLDGLPVPAALAAACIADGDPTLAELQGKAAENPALYGLVSPTAQMPTGGTVGFTDLVDATLPAGQRYVYAATAIDAAGNESVVSCPSVPVLVSDLMPPRAPVATEIVGQDGAIRLTWSRNRESDLERYEIYRTAEEDRLASKRRMTLVLAAADDGAALAAPPAPDAAAVAVPGTPETRLTWADPGVTPGRRYFYRMVAVDSSGNSSPLSEPLTGQAIDLTPPPPPEWETSSPIGMALGVDPAVTLAWQPVQDPSGASVAVQRRIEGSPLWLGVSGWAEGATGFTDQTVISGETYHYRLRAMDGAGNRGDWSTEQSIAVP